MPIAHSPRAPLNITRPEPWAFCDRCNFQYLRSALQWQFDWRGNALQNLRILVCPPCYDTPNEQFRPLIIGPDPVPVKDPRPGYQVEEMGPTDPVPIEQIIGD